MLELKVGQFVKLTGTKVKGENDIYIVEHEWHKNDYCLNKVKLDGTKKESGYRLYFYNEKSIKNDPELQVEIVTDLKKAKNEVNEYLKNLTNNEIDVKFVKAEEQEVKHLSIIRFPNGIKFGTFGDKYIGTRTIWLVKFRNDNTIYITELGKKGQSISNPKMYSCTIGLTKQMIQECEVLTKVETRKGDLVKENKKTIKEEIKQPVVEVIETIEPVTEIENVEEELQQENNQEVIIENETTQATNNIEFTVSEDIHTKTGEKIFVVKLVEKIEYAEFKDIESKIKSIGGYYSRFKKGFLFKEEPTQLLNKTFNGSGTNEVKNNQESNNKVELKEVRPIEINIDNINVETFPISKEISKRENDGHWIFRTKERDYQQEILNCLNNYQNSILEELNKLEDNSIKNKYKYWLNSFKKRYYENYYKRLRNDANNPSWITTGRDGRNARKDAKMNSRYDNLMRECCSLDEEYKDKLREVKGKIIKEKDNRFFNAVLSNKKEYTYKRIKKGVNVSYTENYFTGNLVEKNCYVTTVNNEDFYILSIWGTFIAVNSKGETFKYGSCGTLKDCKQILNYYISEIEKNNNDNIAK